MSEPLGDAFERAIEHWRRHQAQTKAGSDSGVQAPRLTVAFSREAGSGGTRIAQELAEKLNWPVYDRELVERIANDAGLSTEVVERVDEHRSSFITETLEAFVGASTIGGAGYAHRLAQTLAALGAHGECVIVGRGAAAVLPRDKTLSIRIVADTHDRVSEYRRHHEVDRQQAKAELKRIEKERSDFVRQFYHKDVADPHGYDLVVNGSHFPAEACVELCLSAVRHKEACLSAAT